jgi:hypothetical protein
MAWLLVTADAPRVALTAAFGAAAAGLLASSRRGMGPDFTDCSTAAATLPPC